MRQIRMNRPVFCVSFDVFGDSAYAGADTLDDLQQAGFDVIAKVPSASGRAGMFGKDDFNLDLHADTVVTFNGNQWANSQLNRPGSPQDRRRTVQDCRSRWPTSRLRPQSAAITPKPSPHHQHHTRP